MPRIDDIESQRLFAECREDRLEAACFPDAPFAPAWDAVGAHDARPIEPGDIPFEKDEPMTQIRIAHTDPLALTDGPGLRFSIYFQGCRIRCPGCQTPHLHDPMGGQLVRVHDLANQALTAGLPVSVLGGEPFDQLDALCDLLHTLKTHGIPHIIVYTGYSFETLMRRYYATDGGTWWALRHTDVLVDGPFVADLDHDRLQYRGSSNQRVIDVRPSMERWQKNHIRFKPVLLDWDTPELILTPDGDVLAAEGLADEFAALGESAPARRCGETGT
jgi:anaerobic ribonucleoside-triphosphate reductase activating protein